MAGLKLKTLALNGCRSERVSHLVSSKTARAIHGLQNQQQTKKIKSKHLFLTLWENLNGKVKEPVACG